MSVVESAFTRPAITRIADIAFELPAGGVAM